MFENFFDFNVPLGFWITSQIICAVGVAFAMWALQAKGKIKLLLLMGIA